VDTGKKWYVVKVQSGREESIRAAIERKVKIEGLEESFGQIAIPTEDVVEKKKVRAKVKDKKTGEVETVYQEKNVTKKRKKFPGYLFAEVDFNDRILYVFRETSGVGDFVGATHHRAPSPMSDREVQSMLTGIAAPDPNKKKVKIKLDFEKGDKVRIREGAFSGMEGEVKAIPDVTDAASENTKVTVVVSIFGRPVDVELDYWQVDKA
jgi:transcriptional antiterminator NusG